MHLEIYKQRPDIKSVVHCHPPHATAFAITRDEMPAGIHPEVEIFLGRVPITPYRTPGTQDVAETLTPHLKRCEAFILRNHGSVTAGRGLLEALWRTEILDAYCRLLMLAQNLGQPRRLTLDQLGALDQIRQGFLNDPKY